MDFHNCKWPSSVVKPLPQTETPDPSDAPSPEKAGGMRRVGSRNWLPTLDESGAEVKGSPRAMAGREKMLQKLWMSEAVDSYFLRQVITYDPPGQLSNARLLGFVSTIWIALVAWSELDVRLRVRTTRCWSGCCRGSVRTSRRTPRGPS